MELGKVLVHELKLEPSVDTLGRWMAHHIAELIRAAEEASDTEDRREKEMLAAEAIMKIWTHRSQYENRINPLSNLKPVIQVLRTLDPNQNTWLRHYGSGGNEAIRSAYDAFRMLMIFLLLRSVPTAEITSAVTSAKATVSFQEPEEKEITTVIDHWLSDVQRDKFVGISKAKKTKQVPTKTFDKIIRSLITEARTALDRLTEELDKPGPRPAEKQRRKS